MVYRNEDRVIHQEPITPEEMPKTVVCPSCKCPYDLWFNGGELDARSCCGKTYALEASGYRFVVYDGELR